MKMTKKTIAISSIGVILVVLLVVSFFGQSKKTIPTIAMPIYPSREPATTPQTTLEFSQSPLYLNDNGTINAEIFMNTFENKVMSVNLSIGYDPKRFSVISVKPVDLLYGKTIRINAVDETKGEITLAVDVETTKNLPIVGSDSLADIVFKPKSQQDITSEITFLPKTTITAQGITKNALTTTSNATIIIQKVARH
jgi:hypothetical protein